VPLEPWLSGLIPLQTVCEITKLKEAPRAQQRARAAIDEWMKSQNSGSVFVLWSVGHPYHVQFCVSSALYHHHSAN
jgi:hypothetical protein